MSKTHEEIRADIRRQAKEFYDARFVEAPFVPGKTPAGYDHKYVYSHIGYNLKATEMQAAIGVAQMKMLPPWKVWH